MKNTRNSRRGSVSVIALFVVLAIGGLMIAFMQIGLSFTREQASRIDREQAFELAEAGLAESLYAMRVGGTGNVGTRAMPATHGNGVIWTSVMDVGNDTKRILSSSMYGRERVALGLLVFHFEGPLPTTALFSHDNLFIEANVLIDSYDSALGDYATQLAAGGGGYVGDGAVVQTNGALAVASSTAIYGDAHPGANSTLTVAGSSTVTGSMEAMPETRVMPPVVTPVIASGGAYATSALGEVLPSGDYNYSSLRINTGDSLTLTGPSRVVLGDWILRSNTAFHIDSAGGVVEIYISGNVDLASNSSITTSSASAIPLALYFTGGPTQVASLNSNSEFHGTIYAPEGRVEVSSNFEVFGAIAAKQIECNSNVQIHFDEALHTVSQEHAFTAASWSRAAFPDRTLTAKRSDPFALVGYQKHELPTLAEAHDLP